MNFLFPRAAHNKGYVASKEAQEREERQKRTF
jgi:hypothetical protein